MESKPTGGTRYGYGDGEAEVVRQVFQWYVDGYAPQWIAAELNRRKVPSLVARPGIAHQGVVEAGILRQSVATRSVA